MVRVVGSGAVLWLAGSLLCACQSTERPVGPPFTGQVGSVVGAPVAGAGRSGALAGSSAALPVGAAGQTVGASGVVGMSGVAGVGVTTAGASAVSSAGVGGTSVPTTQAMAGAGGATAGASGSAGSGTGGSGAAGGAAAGASGAAGMGAVGSGGAATFTNIYMNIMTPKCVPCHGAGLVAFGNKKEAYQSLVGVDAMDYCMDMKRVVASDPSMSVLILAIKGEGCRLGRPMPPSGQRLSDAEIALFTAWVSAGAKDD